MSRQAVAAPGAAQRRRGRAWRTLRADEEVELRTAADLDAAGTDWGDPRGAIYWLHFGAPEGLAQSRLPSRRGRSLSAPVVNGRLRQTGEGTVRPAPPCSTHTSTRTTRSWPPYWRRNEPDTAAYRAHAGLERLGPLGERRARGRRLHCFVLANDVDTEAFAFTTRPRTHFKRAAARKGIPKVPRFAGPSHWPAGYSRWHSVRENTNRLHVVPRHTTLKLCCTNSCSLNARPRHHRCRLIWTRPNAKDTEARILVTTGPRIHPKFAAVRKGISKCTPFPALSHWLASHARDYSFS